MNPKKSGIQGGSNAISDSSCTAAIGDGVEVRGESKAVAEGGVRGMGVAAAKGGIVSGSSAGIRRKRVVFENGDRFCSTCGQVIYGMARELIARCPYQNCKATQPYMAMWQFQKNNWGRCKGLNCATFIEIDMLYCSTCGTINAPAFERRDRQAHAKRQQEESRLLAKIKELEQRQAVIDAQNREMRDIIESQEQELFIAKELPPSVQNILLADESEEVSDTNLQA